MKDETRLPSEPETSKTAEDEEQPAKPVRNTTARAVPDVSRTEFCSTLAASAAKHDLPVALFANLIWQESKFDPRAVSRVGAQGVAQFMPAVAREVGLQNPFNPLEALPAAARFLSGLVERFGSIGLATAAYNAGPTRVGNWLKKGGGLPKETQHYVRKITGKPAEHWRSAKAGDAVFAMAKGIPCRLGVFAQIEQTGDAIDGREQRVREPKLGIVVRAIAVRPHGSRSHVKAVKAAVSRNAKRTTAAKAKSGKAVTRSAERRAGARVKIAGGR